MKQLDETAEEEGEESRGNIGMCSAFHNINRII